MSAMSQTEPNHQHRKLAHSSAVLSAKFVTQVQREKQKATLAPLLLDRIPDHRRHVRAAETGNGADARRRGDVDLGEVAVDHVDADEQEPALAQLRRQRGANLALAVGK